MKKRIWNKVVSIFTAILLVVGILPSTTVAVMAAAPIGQVIYVGDEDVTSGGYWTTGKDGNVTEFIGEGTPADNFIHYDAEDNVLTLHNATIKEGVPVDTSAYVMDSAIGVLNENGAAELTIQLEGTNTIAEVSIGIYVLASWSNSSLTITGDGSLEASVNQNGIRVQSNNGDAALNIKNAKVNATVVDSYGGEGVMVRSGENSSASLTVNGGSLTATGTGATYSGISLQFGSNTGSGTPTVTVGNNAIVRANGGIHDTSSTDIQIGADGNESNGGIVFDGKNGTVYGDVTLQEDLTINQGESLTITDGSRLNTGNNKVIVNGGTLNGEDKITGTVKYAPTITTESLPEGKVNEEYSASLAANGSEPIKWSVAEGSLPTGLSLSTDGTITGIPTAPGAYVFTVTASNEAGSVSKELTINIKDVDPIYSIQNSGDISFADALEGYTPEVKTITVTNNGNQLITLNQPVSSPSFEVGTLSKKELNVGESATFTVQPKTDLLAGSYDENIEITGANNGESASTTVNVKFNVNHNAVKVERKDPTCTEDGNIEYWYCGACGKYFRDEALTQEIKKEKTIIKAKGHHAVKTEEKPATCTEDGNIEYWYCNDCGKYFSDEACTQEISFEETVIKATGHTAEKTEAKEPTCTEDGNIEYWYCEACGKYFRDEALTQEIKKEETIIKAKGHHAVKIEEKLATCTEDGNIEYWYCDVCNKYFSDAELTNEISIDKTVIPAKGHKLTKVDEKKPTMDAVGNIEYWYCDVCDKYFSDEKAEHKITLEDTIIAKLPKLVNGANQDWTKGSKDGLIFKVDTNIKEFKKVLVDGKELKDTDYDIKSGSTILTLKPSFLDTLSVGKHQIRLEFNNGTIETYFTVKAKETTTVPETGEQTNLYLWAMLAIASGASILVLKRYKKYNR